MAVKKTSMGGDMPLVGPGKDRLQTLERLRDRLMEEIDVTDNARSLILLATRLESVLATLDELGPAAQSCAADEILARRLARRSKRRRPA